MQKHHRSNHGTDNHRSKEYWMYGIHAVQSALFNQKRTIKRLASTYPAHLPTFFAEQARKRRLTIEQIDAHLLQKYAPGAVTQDILALVSPLNEAAIEEILPTDDSAPATLIILDQVTDPQNVGAIMRSGAAFGAAAVILTDHHSVSESGALAKAASGALDTIAMVKATNLSQFMDQIKKNGFWCMGLSHDAKDTIGTVKLPAKIALVFGAEGPGLRRLTRDQCDFMVHLPTLPPIDQLNVSNAAAVTLYEVRRQQLLLTAK